MCNCQMMARDLSETCGGRFPASDHAPGCEDFKQLEFSRIETEAGSCIVQPDSVDEVCSNLDGDFTVTGVMLTQDQFDKLPEVDGF